jgi:ABC-type Zn uptake system ZnuABC Zn-binding protein ZnuA
MRAVAVRKDLWLAGVMLLLSGLTLAGCTPSIAATDVEAEHEQREEIPHLEAVRLGAGEKLSAVATTNIVGDVVAQVGGEAIDLTVLMALGQDPHSYEPAPADVADIETAHVVFVNGFALEEGVLAVIEPLEDRVPVVPVSAGIKARGFGGEHDERAHAGADPHTWMDPHNVEVWAANVADVLSELDSANAATYRANARSYTESLGGLDAYIVEQVSRIPEAERKLVTNHESLGYFADRYGFEVVGTVFIGASELASPSAGEMAALVDTIQDQGAQAIFVETTVSDELASVVADEVGYEVGVYRLYSGSLGESGSGADSYVGMMRANVDAIVAGLTR